MPCPTDLSDLISLHLGQDKNPYTCIRTSLEEVATLYFISYFRNRSAPAVNC